MSDETWRDKYQKTYWKPQEVGDKIVGVFTDVIQKEIAGKEVDVAIIEIDDGVRKDLPAHTNLMYRLAEIELGKTIEITYTGNIVNKFKKEVHQYTVTVLE